MNGHHAWRVGGIAGAVLLIAACSGRSDDTGPTTPDDQRRVNQAAAILDADSLDANVTGAHESSPHD
jgi:hypothetical protein